jgi:hypothetical protein
MKRYVTWLVTLPVPKIITGPIQGTRLNEEMTTIISGATPEDLEYSVSLPGLVAESVYIYGVNWSWFHGLTIGLFAALVMSILGSVKRFSVLGYFTIILFSYHLNRAGLSSIAFFIINGYSLLYFLLIVSRGRLNVFKRWGVL